MLAMLQASLGNGTCAPEKTVQVGTAAPAVQAVQVVSRTWDRDAHDLFDVEAQHLHSQTFAVSTTMVCVRQGTEVQMVDANEPCPSVGDALLRVVQRDGGFWVDKAPSSSAKKLWMVVRDLPAGGHRLAEGDVMKVGRFKFKVRELVSSACGGTQHELSLDDSGLACSTNSDQDIATKSCRICLLEGPGDDDPLIAPCQCKGSMEYVHLGCLRNWIRARRHASEASGGSCSHQSLACELCNAVYPEHIGTGKKRLALEEAPSTQPPFIVLESMVGDSRTRRLNTISLADKALKLGRGHDTDVRVQDVSLSRCHATIRFQRGQFILEDNNSKFGTLVAMKQPLKLEQGSTISIQHGRTVLSLSAQLERDDRCADYDANSAVDPDVRTVMEFSGATAAQALAALQQSGGDIQAAVTRVMDS